MILVLILRAWRCHGDYLNLLSIMTVSFKKPPKSSMKLKQYVLNNKGGVTFPQPPDFVVLVF